MGRLSFPSGHRIFLDSNILIYFAEETRPYADLLAGLFQSIASGQAIGVVSSLSLLETCVLPLKRGDLAETKRFEELLRHSPQIEYIPITDDVLMRAAEIRAATDLRTPDAVHVATSQIHSCDVLLTNDRRLGVVDAPTVVVLADYL